MNNSLIKDILSKIGIELENKLQIENNKNAYHLICSKIFIAGLILFLSLTILTIIFLSVQNWAVNKKLLPVQNELSSTKTKLTTTENELSETKYKLNNVENDFSNLKIQVATQQEKRRLQKENFANFIVKLQASYSNDDYETILKELERAKIDNSSFGEEELDKISRVKKIIDSDLLEKQNKISLEEYNRIYAENFDVIPDKKFGLMKLKESYLKGFITKNDRDFLDSLLGKNKTSEKNFDDLLLLGKCLYWKNYAKFIDRELKAFYITDQQEILKEKTDFITNFGFSVNFEPIFLEKSNAIKELNDSLLSKDYENAIKVIRQKIELLPDKNHSYKKMQDNYCKLILEDDNNLKKLNVDEVLSDFTVIKNSEVFKKYNDKSDDKFYFNCMYIKILMNKLSKEQNENLVKEANQTFDFLIWRGAFDNNELYEYQTKLLKLNNDTLGFSLGRINLRIFNSVINEEKLSEAQQLLADTTDKLKAALERFEPKKRVWLYLASVNVKQLHLSKDAPIYYLYYYENYIKNGGSRILDRIEEFDEDIKNNILEIQNDLKIRKSEGLQTINKNYKSELWGLFGSYSNLNLPPCPSEIVDAFFENEIPKYEERAKKINKDNWLVELNKIVNSEDGFRKYLFSSVDDSLNKILGGWKKVDTYQYMNPYILNGKLDMQFNFGESAWMGLTTSYDKTKEEVKAKLRSPAFTIPLTQLWEANFKDLI